MSKSINLLEGSISRGLLRLSLPLMASSLIGIAYTITDAMWLGRLSTQAVSSVGTTHFYVWMLQAIALIASVGISVGLSQAYGSKNQEEARQVMKAGLAVCLGLCFLASLGLFLASDPIISIYKLSAKAHQDAVGYLKIVSLGTIFIFMTPFLTASFYARGDSLTPFKISILALVFNIVFDPILIFGWGPFPRLEVAGAAIASVLAQCLAVLLLLYASYISKGVLFQIKKTTPLDPHHIKDIFSLGIPACIHSLIHAFVGMVLVSYVSGYGQTFIAVYTIGSQLESLAWMSAEGFSQAMTTFMGQNYGAKKFHRLHRGYQTGMAIVGSFGLASTLLLFFGRQNLFSLFLPKDLETAYYGGQYLVILSFSQIFMTLEIGTAGALNGLALTKYPAIIATVFNLFRIPLALVLMPAFGVNGIWVAMSVSSILKGIFHVAIYFYFQKQTDHFSKNMGKYVSRIAQEGEL